MNIMQTTPDDMFNMGYKLGYFKTTGGRELKKVWLQRIPEKGENVDLAGDVVRVLGIHTILSSGDAINEAPLGYQIVGITHVIFVEFV